MFYKKKNQNVSSWADQEREKFFLEIYRKSSTLEKKVENVLIKNRVIDVYPIGPDKDQARKEATEAKHSLLRAIRALDSLCNEYKNFVEKYCSNIITAKEWEKPLQGNYSHFVIEEYYKRNCIK